MLVKEPSKVAVNLQYQLIKLAWSQYQSAPESLSSERLAKLDQQAKVAQKIMTRVLSSDEAKKEQVKAQEVQFIFEQLQQQFDNIESFELSLDQQGLSEESLREAIHHDLICEKTLASQSLEYVKVTKEEALTYYEQNKARFLQPERRKVSHILVTINNEFVENERQQAWAKIQKLQKRLEVHIEEFANLALQHSECPTSLNKGFIGDISRGQLYPELDDVLFNLATNTISSIVETEVGFHLLLCHDIYAAGDMEKEAALKAIRSQLNQHRQKKCEKKWISSLFVN
jgi:peptidyl-prolyl cis-trans isomerase C